jgi:hypothetical protein
MELKPTLKDYTASEFQTLVERIWAVDLPRQDHIRGGRIYLLPDWFSLGLRLSCWRSGRITNSVVGVEGMGWILTIFLRGGRWTGT